MVREWKTDPKVPGLGILKLPSGVETWYLRYREPGGKQQHHRIGRANVVSRTMAREEAHKLLAAVATGQAPTSARQELRRGPDMADLLTRLQAEHYGKLRPRTRDGYLQLWRLHILPAMGAVKVQAVTTKQVLALLAKIPPIQANRVLAVLRKAFNLAILWGLRDANPCSKVPTNQERSRRRYLSRDELERLLATLDTFAAAGVRWRFTQLVRLLLLTGCRVGEICRGRWEWLDQDAALLRIPAEHHKTGSDGHERVVHLPPAALTILSELRSETAGPWIIAGRNGHHLIGYQKLWEQLLVAAGIRNLRIHDLRHSYASYAITTAGLTLPQVGALLGHASPQTTARYAHLVDEAAAGMAAKVAAVISPLNR